MISLRENNAVVENVCISVFFVILMYTVVNRTGSCSDCLREETELMSRGLEIFRGPGLPCMSL